MFTSSTTSRAVQEDIHNINISTYLPRNQHRKVIFIIARIKRYYYKKDDDINDLQIDLEQLCHKKLPSSSRLF